MIIQAWRDQRAEKTCSMTTAWPNLMVHGKTKREYYSEHCGALSIKTVSSGMETYMVKGFRYEVTPQTYLILNDGQRYASEVNNDAGTESFCIFFEPHLANNVLNGLILPDDHLLDDPDPASELSLLFFEKLYPHDSILTPALRYLQQTTHTGPVTSGWLEEQYRLLLQRLLTVHRNLREEMAKLPVVRHSTRVELYRRLHRAKDFMDSTVGEAKTLPEIAEIACLSTHHFLRAFKDAFGVTPHRYISERKLERASQLLRDTDSSITSICFEVGFESLGTFSRVFRDHYGMSPRQYRQAK